MAARRRTPAIRHVLVTGASSGIGRATAVELARRGRVRLLLVARREPALRETEELARQGAGPDVSVELRPCDLADPIELERLVAELRAGSNPLDVLVNNAGVGGDTPFEEPGAVAEIDAILALNVRAPIVLVQGALPLLVASPAGVVVNVSSVAGLLGLPNSPVYSSSKWALTGFSEALRARVAGAGVRVVCVQPGPVPTPGWPQAWLVARPALGRILATDTATIARVIADAAEGRGGPGPVRPRTFTPLPLLRGVAPWLVRWLLARAVDAPTGNSTAHRRTPPGATR